MKRIISILLCIALLFSFTTFSTVAGELDLDMGFGNEADENNPTITTAYNNAAALRPASASSMGKNGLRIYNSVNKEWVNDSKIIEFGSIAIIKDKLDGAELTLTFEDARQGVAYQRGSIAMKLWETTADSYIYTAYLTNIPEKDYGKEIYVRTYAIDLKKKVYYGDVVSVSVFAIANSIDKGETINGTSPSDIDIAAFKSFVTTNNKETYKEWCEKNNCSVGNLYNEIS